jgi:hypothetical protein
MLLLGVVQAQAAGDEFVSSYDLLATTILTSSASSVTFSSLGDYATDYQHLQVRLTNRRDLSGAGTIFLTFNSVGGTSYATHRFIGNGSSVTSDAFTSRANLFAGIVGAAGATNAYAGAVVDILDPFETTKNTTTRTLTGAVDSSSFIIMHSGVFLSTSAVSSMTLAADAGNFVSGSRFSLYGIKAV